MPAPAATNGQGDAEAGAAALAGNVSIVDAGPFADLIELRHFEEAVARLESVRDVHVRRFGHHRAKVEVGMAGPYAIGRELYRLGRPMLVEPGPDGEIVLDFTDVPTESPTTSSEQPASGAEAEVERRGRGAGGHLVAADEEDEA